MACSKCGKRTKCSCNKVKVVSDTPEVVKATVIPVPGEKGDAGADGDTYIPILWDNFFDI